MDRSGTSGAGHAGGEVGDAHTGDESSGGAMERTRSKVDEAKESVKQELRGARDDVQRRAVDTVNRQKHQVADRLESIVHALHAAHQSLRDDDQSQLASYVGDLTHQVERSTGYLRNNDFGGMMRDMERLARNNTGVFLGSTFVAGMAMGRFLRASEPQEQGGELAGYDTRSYGGGYGAGGFSSDVGTAGSTGRAYGDLENAREFDRGDTGMTDSPRRQGDIGFAGTGRSGGASGGSESTRTGDVGRSEYRTGELGSDRPGGATGTRGSMGAPGEGGLTGGSERGSSTSGEER